MIFVTGATGLLGTHLLKALLKEEQPVKALYRTTVPQFENSDKAIWVKGDILDVPFLEDAMAGITQVYHCAAAVSFQPGQSKNLFVTNVEGTANIVNASLRCGVNKLLHVSSVSALGGFGKNTDIDETDQWSEATNRSVYGKTKYLSEMEVWRGVGEGLEAVIVNPSIILGTGDWNEGSSQIFKTVYNEFPWYTDGVTGFVDVLDVVKAMCLLMNSPVTAERFILNAENRSYKEVFDRIADNFGKKRPHRLVSPFLAGIVWRAESFRSLFKHYKPLLTKETATSAQTKRFFSNGKFLLTFPQFRYTPLPQTLSRICLNYQQKYQLLHK